MPTAYGYVRVSGDSDGIDPQKMIVTATYERKLKPEGYAFARFYEDEKQSRRIFLSKRPAGAELCLVVRRGDAIVIPRIDRAFGSIPDMRGQLDAWQMAGVRVISPDVMNQEIDTTSPLGKFFVTMLGMFAEFEADMCVQRHRDKIANYRRAGKPYTANAPLGFKVVQVHGQRFYQPNEDERSVMAWCLKQHEAGHADTDITRHLNANKVKLRSGGKLVRDQVRKMIANEKKLREMEKGLAPDEFVTLDGVVMKKVAEKGVDLTAKWRYNTRSRRAAKITQDTGRADATAASPPG